MGKFVNKYYKDEWTKYTSTGELYAVGTFSVAEDGTKTVLDGDYNFVGRVLPDGSFVSANIDPTVPPDEYAETFLRAAKECKE